MTTGTNVESSRFIQTGMHQQPTYRHKTSDGVAFSACFVKIHDKQAWCWSTLCNVRLAAEKVYFQLHCPAIQLPELACICQITWSGSARAATLQHFQYSLKHALCLYWCRGCITALWPCHIAAQSLQDGSVLPHCFCHCIAPGVFTH